MRASLSLALEPPANPACSGLLPGDLPSLPWQHEPSLSVTRPRSLAQGRPVPGAPRRQRPPWAMIAGISVSAAAVDESLRLETPLSGLAAPGRSLAAWNRLDCQPGNRWNLRRFPGARRRPRLRDPLRATRLVAAATAVVPAAHGAECDRRHARA